SHLKMSMVSSSLIGLTAVVSDLGMPLDWLLLKRSRRSCCWQCTYTGRTTMAKKSSVSSRPVRLRSVTSEDIGNRKWTEKERAALRRLAASQAAGEDSDIDFSDIPPLTDEQLRNMVRLRDFRRKVPVSVRLDPRVLEWLKAKGEGHLTRINDILMNLMEAEQSKAAET